MQLAENGSCPFWGEDQWCSLQRRFGERLLPDVCAHYPRSISLVGDEMELAGQLSCPEVTRRCLLDENSCDLVEVDEVRFARGAFKQRTFLACGEPYYERFLEVRETFTEVLSRRDFPLRSRLFFLLAFADCTAPFFHRGTQTFNEDDWNFERDAMRDPAILNELHTELGKFEMPDGLAMFVIAEVLAGDVHLRAGGRFRDVVTEVLDSYHAEIGATDVSAEEMWTVFVKRRDAKMARSGARIDELFEKYCKQYFLRDWYVDSLSLFSQLQGLLVRIAVMRFLFLSHPDEDVDKLAVRVVSAMARGIEHHDKFLKLIGEALTQPAAHLHGSGGAVVRMTPLAELVAVKHAAAAALLARSDGVVGVGVGTRQKGGRPTGEPCVRVYVEHKLPAAELSREAMLPRPSAALAPTWSRSGGSRRRRPAASRRRARGSGCVRCGRAARWDMPSRWRGPSARWCATGVASCTSSAATTSSPTKMAWPKAPPSISRRSSTRDGAIATRWRRCRVM